MRTDPVESRRRGLHRLRMVTASVVAAAVIGAGALTWAVAAEETTGSTPVAASSGDESATGTASDDTTSDATGSGDRSTGTTLGSSDSDQADASSGGS
jgi:hypothetical protein